MAAHVATVPMQLDRSSPHNGLSGRMQYLRPRGAPSANYGQPNIESLNQTWQ